MRKPWYNELIQKVEGRKMETTGIKRYSLSKQVSDKLEEMIANGEYKVGEKINSESELMAMFSVSRNTLREAIHSLTSVGVLEVKQGDGTYVRSNNRFSANMKIEYDKVDFNDIEETRNALEITIAELAAKRRTNEDLKNIEASLNKRKDLNENANKNTKFDMEFHLKVAEACHNKILIDLYLSIFDYLESFISEKIIGTNLDTSEINDLHEKLFEAIKSSDSEQARICARNIISNI